MLKVTFRNFFTKKLLNLTPPLTLYEGYTIDQINDEAMDGIITYENWDVAVEDFIENFLEISDNSAIYCYIDYEKIQRDLEIDRYVEYKGTIFANFN